LAVETIFRRRRKRPETKAAYLPRQPSRGKAMIEAVMALSVFFSASIFLAHAFDAYRMR
jgi:hypothetical protein